MRSAGVVTVAEAMGSMAGDIGLDVRPPAESAHPVPPEPGDLASVAAELEALFAAAPAPSVQSAGRNRHVRSLSRGPAAGRGPRIAPLAALIGAGLIGLGAGALTVRIGARPAAPPAPVIAALPLRQPAEVPPPTSSPASSPEAPAAPATARAGPSAAPARARASRPEPARRRAAALRRAPSRACGRACAYRDLMQADVRLRSAYFRAIAAGTPRSVLNDYRRRWSGLLRHASSDPARAARGYRVLERQLSRAARSHPRGRR